MNHHLLLIIHLVSACIWVGGHLYLAIRLLPKILKQRNVTLLLNFEKSYEPVGMTALLLLVISGIWMSLQFGIQITDWFSFSNPLERVVSLKLTLLLATVAFALSARIFVIPKLKENANKLILMAFHILAVTLIGLTMLILGTFVRYGGILAHLRDQ